MPQDILTGLPAVIDPSLDEMEVSDPLSGEEFWARLPSDELGDEVIERLQQINSDPLSTTIASQVARAYSSYFGLDASGVHATSQMLRGGEVGELAMVRVPHARALVNTIRNLITSSKLVWQTVATNNDFESVRQTELSNSVLEYYWSELRVSAFAERALEGCIGPEAGDSFLLLEWDSNGGEEVVADVKSGDVKLTNVASWDIFRDPFKASFEDLDWTAVRLRRNKFSLATQYPDFAEEILKATSDIIYARGFDSTRRTEESQSDDAYVYLFLYKPCAALPTGRKAFILPDGTVIEDGEYEECLLRVAAGERFGTPYAYTPYLDILGIQQLMDSLETSVATNQTTFATQNILVPEGSSISEDQISGGVKLIYFPPDAKFRPEALQLTSTPPEVFSNLARLRSAQELIMGLNAVVRGEAPSGKEMSGTALALLQSQALQQSSSIAANYVAFVEAIGTSLLRLLQKNLRADKQVAIVGKSNAYLVSDATFNGDSFSQIRKVKVEVGNPLAQTPSGRFEMATQLMQLGVTKDPVQIQQVLATGKLEPLTQSLNSELMLIRSENEQLLKGEAPVTFILDDHQLHAREHRSVMASPNARGDANVVKAVLAHIEEHERLWTSAPPMSLIMVGQQPPPMMGPGPGMPPPPPGEAGSGEAPPAAPMGVEPGMTPAPAEQPRLPTNPATGRQWNPEDGGL